MRTLDLEVENASCTLWLKGTPKYAGRPTATIGRFHCADHRSGVRLIDLALETIQEHGVFYVIGPMDGNTWNSYRFVIDGDESPAFFMEPTNPDFYPEVFRQRGFEVIGHYSSARAKHVTQRRTDRYQTRLQAAGIRVRPFALDAAEDELRRIHGLSLQAFSGNFLYTPISETDFLAMYRPVVDVLIPEFVLLAEDGANALQAFLFAIPDLVGEQSPDQLIIKTYASRFPGLGGYLADLVHVRSRRAGFKAVVHALMHEENVSELNSRKLGGRTFRRYVLFGREIGV